MDPHSSHSRRECGVDASAPFDIPFDALPDPKRVWPFQPGSYEEGLGRLNLLTPRVVAEAAASCIKTGRRASLSWDLTKLDIANFKRQPLEHKIIPLMGDMAFDDIYSFNPQQTSQWDGLRHFSQPAADGRLFYGGTTSKEILTAGSTRIGMQHWAREGICGRGVLIDYVRYAERRGIAYSTFSDHSIPLSTLKDIATEQNVTFRKGDILFVRIGVTREWDTKMAWADKEAYASTKSPQHAGVEGTVEMLRFIWDTGIVAVAGDAISFEVYPPKAKYPRGNGEDVSGVFMHEYLLAGWGMPVGELFDLEALSIICEEEKRWDFFVASMPLSMPGGVSSTPNAVAIF